MRLLGVWGVAAALGVVLLGGCTGLDDDDECEVKFRPNPVTGDLETEDTFCTKPAEG